MSGKSLLALPLIGVLGLFLTGSVQAQGPWPPQWKAEQPRTHTVTINNGDKVVRRTFAWRNGSWQICGSGNNRVVSVRAKEVRRVKQLQQRGLLQPPMPGGFPGGGMPFGPEPRTQSVQEARLGAQLSQPSATLVDQLDLPKGQGMVLEEVGPNSPVARAGMKTHDILLEVNGKPVPSKPEEFDKLLAGIEANKKVDAVVLRKGVKKTVKGLSLPEEKRGLLQAEP
jgi:hypothetical protein